MDYQPMLEPGSEEFERRMNEAYERYANSEPSTVQNERIRPEDQDFFDWLMEDKESMVLADEMIREAGFKW
jgi:hypothetical protein